MRFSLTDGATGLLSRQLHDFIRSTVDMCGWTGNDFVTESPFNRSFLEYRPEPSAGVGDPGASVGFEQTVDTIDDRRDPPFLVQYVRSDHGIEPDFERWVPPVTAKHSGHTTIVPDVTGGETTSLRRNIGCRG